MKRFLAIFICLLILISFTACAGKKNKDQKIDELNKAIASQSLVASGEKLAFDINGGKWLMSGVKNETAEDIEVSELVIAFLAWDKNGAPIQIKTEKKPDNTSYLFEMSIGEAFSVSKGEVWEGNVGLHLSDSCAEITYLKAIAVSAKIAGKDWKNSYYDKWKEMYQGEKLTDKSKSEMTAQNSESISSENSGMIADDSDMTIAKLEAALKNEGVYITSSSVYKNENKGDIFLTADIKNNTDKNIKSVNVAFAAWDKEGNPILIKSASGNTEDSYIKEVNLGSTPILPGFEWVSETEDSVTGLCVDSSQTEITYAEAIVISFTADDGNERSNPYYDIWKVFYEGKERVNKEAQ